MHARTIFLTLALPAFTGLSLYQSILTRAMVNKLNAVLPPERQFAQVGWPGKHGRLGEAYRAAFPADRLMRQRKIARVLCFIVFTMVAGMFVFR